MARFDTHLRFGVSTLGKSIPWTAADAFTLYFLTDVARLPPAEAGLLVLLFFCWNAACDPVAGWLFDRFRLDRLGPAYFRAGALAVAAAFALSFACPPAGPWRVGLIAASGLGFRTAFSAVDVPHNALLARLSGAAGGAIGLSAIRLGAGVVASFATAWAAALVFHAGAALARPAFAAVFGALGLLGMTLFLGWLPPCGPRPGAAGPPKPEGASGPARPAADWLAAGLLFACAAVTAIVTGLFSKDVIYVAEYVLNDAGWTVTALTALALGKLAGAPVWTFAAKALGAGWAMRLALGLMVATSLALAGVGRGPDRLSLMMAVLGFALGGVNMLTWSLLADIAARFERRNPDGQARLFGAFTAVTKVAAGLSGALLGLVLAAPLSGPAAGPGLPARLTQLLWLGPAVGGLVGLACIGGLGALTGPRRGTPASGETAAEAL